MMGELMAFLDLNTDIKPWLGIDVVNITHDAVLTIINNAMEQAVKNFTETDFELHPGTVEILDANESDIILPHNVPITAVSELAFYTLADGTDGQIIEATDYQVREEGIILQNIHTPFRRSRIRVTYTWGYDGLPDDVKLMLLQAVEAEFRRKARKSVGTGGNSGAARSKKDESDRTGGTALGAWDKKTGLPKELVYKLTPYKRFEFVNSPMATRNL